jgi:hypothetical protein
MRELGTFVVVYPCWVLMRKDSFGRDESGRRAWNSPVNLLLIDNKGGSSTVPIFSDGDLAVRFKTESGGFDEFLTVKVPTPEMLISILEQNRNEADSMSFDQPKLPGKPFAIWPIEYAIHRLRAGELL